MMSMEMMIFYSMIPLVFLGITGMGLLIFGVSARRDHTFASTSAAIVAFIITARLLFAGPNGAIFGGLFFISEFTRYADLLILVSAAGGLLLSIDYNARAGIARFEFPVLVIFSVIGMMVMVSANDMLTLYVGLEIQSIAFYIIATFARHDVRSAEAGLKFFILNALASGLLLYGISLVYGFAGSTNFTAIASVLHLNGGHDYGAVIGVVFVLVGLAFKISAAPFHMWTPDVFQGAPTSVTSLFATAPKVASMALLIRVMLVPFAHLLPQWQLLVEIIAVASMLIGALGAIGQTSIKRLMAYSSIGHMGYALVGLAAGTAQGVRGMLIYLAIYIVMSLGVFGCMIAMRRRGRPVELMSDLAGMAGEDSRYALALAVLMLAMAGIPPLSGFFAKLYVFYAAVQAGLVPLAVIGVLISVLSTFYYLRIIKIMYFDTGTPNFDQRHAGVSFVIMASAIVTSLFVFYPSPVTSASQAASHALLAAGPPPAPAPAIQAPAFQTR
jgi:NADH-quinone oxidoreductase subunit N